MRHQLPPLLALLMLTACTSAPTRVGVEVFAEDTLPVLFTVTMLGPLEIGVEADRSWIQPDKSLLFQTPATLIVQAGEGSALISPVKGDQRIAVQPLGVSPDSAERAAVVGNAVKITRTTKDAPLTLEVEKP